MTRVASTRTAVVTGRTAVASRATIPVIQNLCPVSEQFDNAAWTKFGGITVAPNTADVTDPNGGSTADKFTYDGTGAAGGARLAQAIIVEPHRATAYTGGIHGRTLTGTRQLSLSINVGTTVLIMLTTAWQRFSLSSPTDIDGRILTVTVLGDGIDNSAGDWYFWGASLNNSNRLSGYATGVVNTGRIRGTP